MPPTRQTVARQLKRLTKKHSKLLKTTLQKIDSLALTVDFWADKKQNSYLCLTGHFVNEKYDLHSKILAFTVFEGQHTGERIGYRIEAELKHLQVYEKTTTITCDGASNMLKSFDWLNPKRLLCLAHKLHLVVCNSLCLWVKKSSKDSDPPSVDKQNTPGDLS